MSRHKEEAGAEQPDWLTFVPPGGLVMLGAIVAVLGAIAARELGFAAVQLLLIAVGLIAAGVGVMRSFQKNGTATGTLLTGGGAIRLLILLGAITLLLLAGMLLVEPDERATALTAVAPQPEPPGLVRELAPGIPEPLRSKNFQWGAPGGGLPDGYPAPFPWMFYTFAVCLVLGSLLTAVFGIGLFLKWQVRGQYVADEPAPVETQVRSALLLVLAAVVAFLAYRAFDPAWDSGRMFTCVAALVALLGAMLLLLPLAWRKVLVSVCIVLHFGGIASAILTVPPPGAESSWLARKVWLIFYRPYLQFTYMNNAYRFYSPEPGPADYLWVYLRYEGGAVKEIRLPSRADSPVPLYYQRMLSVTAGITHQQPILPNYLNIKLATRKVDNRIGLVNIPLHPEIDERMQYKEPNPGAKALLAAYARHLARMHPSLNGRTIEAIKFYRVTHLIISTNLLAEGKSAEDPRLYHPVYCGTYHPSGELLDPKSPFLYWLLPIINDAAIPDRLRDYQAIHAADWDHLRPRR